MQQEYLKQSGAETQVEHDGIRRAIRFMDVHYKRDISLEEIALNAQLSPAYLSFLFRKEAGMSLMHYLTGLRMNTAQKLLKTTNYSIRDISRMVGYQESSYFTSVFRKRHSCTPSEFRSLGAQ